MAHFAVGFLALGLLALVLAGPAWVALLLVIPVMLSALVIRLPHSRRRDTVTARSLLGSETVALGRHRRPAIRQVLLGVRASQGRPGTAASRGDVRDTAPAHRGQRRPRAQPVRLAGYASGLPPLRSTHAATPAPIPSSSAMNEPTNGRLAQPRPASNPYRPGPVRMIAATAHARKTCIHGRR